MERKARDGEGGKNDEGGEEGGNGENGEQFVIMADTAGGEKDAPKSGWNGFIDGEALTARKSRTGLFCFQCRNLSVRNV